MSTNKYKFAVRFRLPFVDSDQKMCDLLSRMNLDFEYDENFSDFEIKDDHWEVHFGTETGTLYIDYILSESEYDFYGSIDIHEINEIRNKFPMMSRPDPSEIKIVAYGWYTGVDEPEIF